MKRIPQYEITENIKEGIYNPEMDDLNRAKDKLLNKTLQKSISKNSKTKKKTKKRR